MTAWKVEQEWFQGYRVNHQSKFNTSKYLKNENNLAAMSCWWRQREGCGDQVRLMICRKERRASQCLSSSASDVITKQEPCTERIGLKIKQVINLSKESSWHRDGIFNAFNMRSSSCSSSPSKYLWLTTSLILSRRSKLAARCFAFLLNALWNALSFTLKRQ